MAIQVNGTEVISNSRALNNIASVDATTAAAFSSAGIGGLRFVSVSGTSQTLDISSGDWFYSGTHTANTTISFSNIPSGASSWTYTYTPALLAGSGFNTFAHDDTFNHKFDISAVANAPADATNFTSAHISGDGTKLFLSSGAKIFRYNLTAAKDANSAVYQSTVDLSGSFSGGAQGLHLNPTGTRMYLSGASQAQVRQFNLSTAWDITTASYSGKNIYTSAMQDFTFDRGGTRGLLTPWTGTSNTVIQYSSSTPFELSNTGATGYNLTDMNLSRYAEFSPTGDALLALDTSYNLRRYTLSTPYDISTRTNPTGNNIQLLNSATDNLSFTDDLSHIFWANSSLVRWATTGTFTSLATPAATGLGTVQRVGPTKIDFYTVDGGVTINAAIS